jgi:hypothetical protein
LTASLSPSFCGLEHFCSSPIFKRFVSTRLQSATTYTYTRRVSHFARGRLRWRRPHLVCAEQDLGSRLPCTSSTSTSGRIGINSSHQPTSFRAQGYLVGPRLRSHPGRLNSTWLRQTGSSSRYQRASTTHQRSGV